MVGMNPLGNGEKGLDGTSNGYDRSIEKKKGENECCCVKMSCSTTAFFLFVLA